MVELNKEYVISDQAGLRDVISEPMPGLSLKVFDGLFDDARAFIAESPLIMFCTIDNQGKMDISPKGDAPGFVEAADEHTLIIPDRPGNRLAYGFNNLLESPSMSLIFLRPGVRETLRVNGKGTITRDPAILERHSVGGKPALLCTVLEIDECFFHCGKAMIRSKLWQPDSWAEPRSVSFGKQLAKRMADAAGGAPGLTAEQIDEVVEDDYKSGLY